MKKTITNLITKVHAVICIVLLSSVFAMAQTNIAPSATASASTCNTGACSTLNDLNFGTCGTQQMWITTTTPPSTTPGVNWIDFVWSSPKTFNKFTIHHAQTGTRFLAGGTCQKWDASTSAWVTFHTFSGLPNTNCSNVVNLPISVTSLKFRITAFLASGSQLSNMNFREIEIWESSSAPNDAGVAAITSPGQFCGPGTQTVAATIQNYGTNQISVVTVNWSVAGTTQTPFTYTSTLDTFGGPNNTASVTLGTYSFPSTSVALKVWTSSPNSVTDTVRANDTAFATKGPSMSGVFTINPLGTGGNNYTSFATATADLATKGVCGPVIFNVLAATYSEQVNIPPINGTSPTNTVLFDGGYGNAATRIISSSVNTAPALIFNNCAYVTVRNLTIATTTANSQGVIFTNSSTTVPTCKANTLSNCIINMPAVTASATSYGITSSTGTTYGYAANAADSLTIDSNSINGLTYYGIWIYGGTTVIQTTPTPYNRNFKIRYNTLNNNYGYGITVYYVQNGIDIIGNKVNMNPAGASYGFYIYYCANHTGTVSHRISDNTMQGAYYNYIYYTTSGVNNPTIISNNMVYNMRTGTNYGWYIYNATGFNGEYWIYHNTVNLNTNSTGGYGIYYYNTVGGNNTYIKNNLLVAATAAVYPLYCNTNPTGNRINYNVYFNRSGTSGYLLYRGATYTGLNTTWLSSSAGGDSSFNYMPSFVNPNTNLHLMDACGARGVDLTAVVPKDIDADTRSNPPLIGADEAGGFTLDAQAEVLLSPVAPITLGAQDLIVRVKNVGSTAISSLDVSYRLNNGTPVTQTWFGSLAACDTTSIIFTGSQQITLISINNLKVYTASPNFTSDDNRSNDTIFTSLFAPMSGNYTIGGTGADFATFTAAVAALSTGGVTGPVRFIVAAGTYNENPVINGPIIGTSSTNTVNFDGGNGNATTRIITFNATAGATVVVNNARWIHFRNLTITNSSAICGYAMVGNSTGSGIQRCIVNLPIQTSTSSSGYCINATGAVNGNGISAMTSDSLTIDSNIVNGGGYAIVAYGSSNASANRGFRIRYNVTNNTNYMGGYIAYNYNAIELTYNTFNMVGTNYGYYGLYYYYNQNSTTASHQIIGNKVLNFGGYGIYLYYPVSSVSAGTTKIYNNIVKGGTGSSYPGYYGIYLYQGVQAITEVYQNTLLMNNSAATSTTYTCFYNTGSANTFIRNNIFAVINGAYTPVYLATSPTGNTVNYNLYYNATGTSANLLYRGTFFNPSNYRTNTAGGDSSFNSNPPFVNLSTGDFHINNGCLRSTFDCGVGTDIEFNTRSTTPNIGAYEYPGSTLDITPAAIMEPVFPVSAGTQDLRVRVQNNGTTAVTSFYIAYRLNNGTPVIQYWTGSLNSCDTTSVIFTGSQQITILNGFNSLKVYTSLPNSSADLVPMNDTINTQLSTPMSGTYIIGAAPSDFTTFTAAIAAVQLRGVGGPITFNVRTGTYNESVTVPSLTGSSATNTVTFKSMANHRDSVIVNAPTTATTGLAFAGGWYVNFKNMTIQNTYTGGSVNGVQIMASSSYDSVVNCKILIPVYPASTQTNYLVNGNGIAGSTGMVFKGNLMNGGYYGTYLQGGSQTAQFFNYVFDGNTITNTYYYAMYTYYSNKLRYTNNTIIPIPNSVNTYQYIYFMYTDTVTVTGNYFNMQNQYTYWYMGYYARNGAIGTPTMGLVANNVVIGDPAVTSPTLYWGYQSSNMAYYNNSISLPASTSYAVYVYNSGSLNCHFKNNVFANTGGGNAAYFAAAPSSTSMVMDYNNYYTTGAALMAGTPAAANISAWKTACNCDMNSVSYRPGFTGLANLAPLATDTASWSLNGRGKHLANNLSTDYNGNPRPTTLDAGVPDIGAFEFTPTSTPPLAVASGAPSAGNTQTFTFGGDTVARVTWDASLTPPTALFVRQYTAKPALIGTSPYYMYFYNALSASNTGTFGYDMKMYYKKAWLGTLINLPTSTLDGNLTVAQKATPTTSAWANVSSGSGDSVQNTVTGQYLYSFGWFTASDITYPVPVNLVNLNANLSGNNVLVNWITASEQNSDRYIVERSIDGSTFVAAGTVKAAGNSNTYRSYLFTDADAKALMATGTMYYRLAMYDRDGHMEYSKVVSVSNNNDVDVSLFPNPFNNQLVLNINSNEAGNVTVAILDINGKQQYSSSIAVSKGSNTKVLEGFEGLSSGIYFARINSETSVKVIKLIKK